jgi:uncharacterized protein YecE (DUF72 family)
MPVRKGKLYIGTSNVVIPGSKKTFPEEFRSGTRLQYYSSLFNSVELNSTFYKLHKADTFRKWTDEVQDDFRFTIKLWREITHQKKLKYSLTDLDAFMQSAFHVGRKKGCLLIQFPPSITADLTDTVAGLLELIDERNDKPKWKVCVEFRHPSWYQKSTFDLLRQFNASIVFHDIPKSKTPMNGISWKTIYLRFHGPTGNYRGDYSEEHLQQYAQQIKKWLAARKDVYAYFNNTMGNAFANARFLKSISDTFVHTA